MTKFWEAMAGKLADRWAAVAGTALVFWASGLLAVFYDAHRAGRAKDLIALLGGQPVVVHVALVATALVLVMASGLVVRRLVGLVLVVVQGHWRGLGLGLLALWSARLAAGKTARRQVEWNQLSQIAPDQRTAKQRRLYIRLDSWLRHRPIDAAEALPTPLGNTVQAGDARLVAKYGLVPAVVWPRLWLVLPQHVREELTTARAAVDTAASAIVWGTAFSFFAIWSGWAFLVAGAVVALTMAFWLPHRVSTMVDLTESVFDLYRFNVYEQLRLPVPEQTDTESVTGTALTTYLYRGLLTAPIQFTTGAKDTAK